MRLIGRHLKLIRVSAGLTQIEFSERIGIARSTLALIETNVKPVSKKVEVAVRATFNVDDDTICNLLENRIRVLCRDGNLMRGVVHGD